MDAGTVKYVDLTPNYRPKLCRHLIMFNYRSRLISVANGGGATNEVFSESLPLPSKLALA